MESATRYNADILPSDFLIHTSTCLFQLIEETIAGIDVSICAADRIRIVACQDTDYEKIYYVKRGDVTRMCRKLVRFCSAAARLASLLRQVFITDYSCRETSIPTMLSNSYTCVSRT